MNLFVQGEKLPVEMGPAYLQSYSVTVTPTARMVVTRGGVTQHTTLMPPHRVTMQIVPSQTASVRLMELLFLAGCFLQMCPR